MLSVFRRGLQHWCIQRMEGRVDRWDFSWDLDAYLKQDAELFGYESHFRAWAQSRRKNPIAIIKYDHLWEFLHEIVEFSRLPPDSIVNFPRRRSRATDWQQLQPQVQDKINSLLGNLATTIEAWPDYSVLTRGTLRPIRPLRSVGTARRH